MTDGNAISIADPPSRCTCLNTSSLDGRECPRVKDPARIRSCVTRSGEIVGVDDEVVVNDDGEEEGVELFFSAGDDEYEWKRQLRVGGVTPGEVDDVDDVVFLSSVAAEYYRCSDEERGRNCLCCFVLHSIKVKLLQQQLGALVLCS